MSDCVTGSDRLQFHAEVVSGFPSAKCQFGIGFIGPDDSLSGAIAAQVIIIHVLDPLVAIAASHGEVIDTVRAPPCAFNSYHAVSYRRFATPIARPEGFTPAAWAIVASWPCTVMFNIALWRWFPAVNQDCPTRHTGVQMAFKHRYQQQPRRMGGQQVSVRRCSINASQCG